MLPLLVRPGFLTAGCSFLLSTTVALAHPVPDVPVRAHFNSDGSARFEVEIDLRCFADDPENEPYYIYQVLRTVTEERKSELKEPAKVFLENTMKIFFPPIAEAASADFSIDFGKVGGGELKEDEDPVALFATWETKIPEGAGYQLEALESGELSVLFLNHLDGIKQKRMQVLFPGEISKVLDLSNIAEDAVKGAAPPEVPEPGAESAEGTEAPALTEPETSAAILPSDDEIAEDNRSTLSIVAIVGVGLGIVVAVLLGRR